MPNKNVKFPALSNPRKIIDSFFQNYLHKKLTIPLAILTVTLLILAIFFPWQGLFVNLASSLIGSLITVLYIDTILKKKEDLDWRNTRNIINRNIRSLADSVHFICLVLFASLDIPHNVVSENKKTTFIREIYIPEINTLFNRFNTNSWQFFFKKNKEIELNAERIIELFGGKLDEEIYFLVMELIDKEKSISTTYRVYKEIIGISDGELPLDGYGDMETAKTARKLTTWNLEQEYKCILETTIRLYDLTE